MQPVARMGRILDAVGLGVFVLGGALVARAWIGFREVQALGPGETGAADTAVEFADGFWFMQRMGVAIMILGVAVFVGAWWAGRQGSDVDA